MNNLPSFAGLPDQELKKLLRENEIGLTVDEARKVEKVLGRTPTLTEAILWGIQGSEHCSYKSSRRYLKLLPTNAPNVIIGPGEDSGIVEIARDKTEKYGIVVSHESHNHPSQIVPFEGAATGIGGCVRDVLCMGARVIGVLDPLRFGDIAKNESRQIAEGVVSGIGGYGNPIGVPNLGGDAYYEKGFDDNCLVNVVAIGVIKESQIIHSFVPKTAAKENWDVIVVGKPTDFSGMGGAAFASLVLDESQKEKNKGAVQEPNPFLKRHLLVSTYDLIKTLEKGGQLKKVSFKDMGAGGITCATVEQVAKSGLGAELDLSKVNVAVDDLPPHVIACAETQERFAWMCHPSLTKKILEHYNVKWDLPSVAENACACVIGKVKTGNFVLKYRGEDYVNASSKAITDALQYDRPFKPAVTKLKEPALNLPQDLSAVLLDLLSSENIASRRSIYERYDKQVQGMTVVEAGEADAGVIAPLMDEKVSAELKKTGAAFSTDGNPRYAMISAYWGAANAVVESMRNVAAVGAYPIAITDCLNYGNPEKQDQMNELKEGIEGIAAACKNIRLKKYPRAPTPVISGNVSLYNESKNGHIPPSAIICCIGKIDDYDRAVTMQFKKAGSKIYLLGERKDELGGSEYYRMNGHLGANVPKPDFTEAEKEIYAVTDAAAAGLILAAHDISEGGLAVTLAEMSFGGRGEGKTGFTIDLDKIPKKTLREDIKLFSETGGFVLEVPASGGSFANGAKSAAHSAGGARTSAGTKAANDSAENKFLAICKKYGLTAHEIGITTFNEQIVVKNEGKIIMNLPVQKAADNWLNGLRTKLQ
jgi:phosphoribosylformylglycinamidine synthase subunit PurL